MRFISNYNFKVDLHCHSIFSDGVKNLVQIKEMAVQAKLDYFSITDHDNIKGNLFSKELFQDTEVNYINGVEISAKWRDKTIHVLALRFKEDNSLLLNLLDKIQTLRKERVSKIILLLDRQGISSCKEYVKCLLQGKQKVYKAIDFVGSLDIAHFLVKHNYVNNIKQAYQKYLARDGISFVNITFPYLQEVVATIIAANGIAVLAHPQRYKLLPSELNALLQDFKECGGVASELIINNQFTKFETRLLKMINNLNLYASAGSDYHGYNNYKKIGALYQIPNNAKPIYELFY